MIQYQLEESIYDFVGLNNIDPTLIIMHPLTYINLEKEIRSMIMNFNSSLNYRGIEIFRSPDIEEGKFIIK